MHRSVKRGNSDDTETKDGRRNKGRKRKKEKEKKRKTVNERFNELLSLVVKGIRAAFYRLVRRIEQLSITKKDM